MPDLPQAYDSPSGRNGSSPVGDNSLKRALRNARRNTRSFAKSKCPPHIKGSYRIADWTFRVLRLPALYWQHRRFTAAAATAAAAAAAAESSTTESAQPEHNKQFVGPVNNKRTLAIAVSGAGADPRAIHRTSVHWGSTFTFDERRRRHRVRLRFLWLCRQRHS